MYRVTKIVRFETAHKLNNYDGPCHNIHGHSYKAEITVKTETLNNQNMVIDFKDLKYMINQLIEKWDHAMFVYKNDTDLIEYCEKNNLKIIVTKYDNTSAELMSEIIFDHMDLELKNIDGVFIDKVKLFETETSFAEYSLN